MFGLLQAKLRQWRVGLVHLNKPYLLGEPAQTISVFNNLIVLICFLFRNHLGISVGFPEAFVWMTVFAFSIVLNVLNVTLKIAPMARWACASQQAIPARVRELSKNIAIIVNDGQSVFLI
jgi:hypothetical protein